MKVFISCPFTGLCSENKYEVKDEYKEFFDKLINIITEKGMDYYLAIKRENWGIDHKGPQECTLSDFNGVKDSDALIVIPGNRESKGISGGVHVELGWASALNKDMYILLEDNFNYSPVVHGLDALTNVKYYTCNDFLNEDMLNAINRILDEIKEV